MLPPVPTRCLAFVLLLARLPATSFAQAAPAQEAFQTANKLYEQGQFADAANAYQSLLQHDTASPALYFNLGNASFKQGNLGRAIAAYRLGLRLAPRDPSFRFNLQFVRNKAAGSEPPPAPLFQQWLGNLTTNEWTILATAAYWLWFCLLSLREIQLHWRRPLRGYTATTGTLSVLLAVCALASYRLSHGSPEAVVVTSDAVVRYGPQDVSKVFYQLKDGSEVRVLDQQPGSTPWFLIKDASGREGWVKATDLLVLDPLSPNT